MTTTRLAILVLLIAGCAQHRYYYNKPAATYEEFTTDHQTCVRQVGIANGNGTHALVSPELYRPCMTERGWTRARHAEPAPVDLFFGVERQAILAIDGPPPARPRGAGADRVFWWKMDERGLEQYCRQKHLVPYQSVNVPAYRACLSQRP
jgi:hypothetical protein